jgi:GNAT superfamily N-acetyltransferase
MTRPTIRIEPATEADVPALLQLICSFAEYVKPGDQVEATEARLRETLFGSAPKAEALLAVDDTAPVGFAVFFSTYSTFLGRAGIYLEDLYVLPDRRGSGIGKLLLSAVARVALDRECGRLEWTALNRNTPAIRFYEGLGAAALPESTVFRLSGESLQVLGSRSTQAHQAAAVDDAASGA